MHFGPAYDPNISGQYHLLHGNVFSVHPNNAKLDLYFSDMSQLFLSFVAFAYLVDLCLFLFLTHCYCSTHQSVQNGLHGKNSFPVSYFALSAPQLKSLGL